MVQDINNNLPVVLTIAKDVSYKIEFENIKLIRLKIILTYNMTDSSLLYFFLGFIYACNAVV